MSAQVFDGDEWKHAAEPKPAPVRLRQRTRAEQQEWIDEQYLLGRVSLAQWRTQTDYISGENSEGNIM